MLFDVYFPGYNFTNKCSPNTDLLFGHPSVSLLGVPEEQLEVHALLVQDASLFPQLQQAGLLVGQVDQLLLDLALGEVIRLQQLLAGLGGRAETVLTGIDLALGERNM